MLYYLHTGALIKICMGPSVFVRNNVGFVLYNYIVSYLAFVRLFAYF